MSHKEYKSGDHLVLCQSCGAQRYRSECDYTWDGLLMCHIRNCWYTRHPIFDPLPVINDPATIYDISPPAAVDTYVSDAAQVGLMTTWDNCNTKWEDMNVKWDEIDNPPNYIGS